MRLHKKAILALAVIIAVGLTGCFGNDTVAPEKKQTTVTTTSDTGAVQATRGQKNIFPVTVTVTADSLKVRAGAGQSFETIGGARKGDSFTAIGREGDWFKIEFAEGAVGYLNAQFVSLAEQG